MMFRIALIVVVAVSVVVCPLSLGGWGLRQGAYAEGWPQQPFTFVPSLANLELTQTVEGPRLGAVTSVPTLGPGQYFEEGDEDLLPEVTRPDLLDAPFGYSEILGHPGLYLVWSTDEQGNKRYCVIDEDNPYYDDIRGVVDANRRAWEELDAQAPLIRMGLGFIGTLAFTSLTVACGIGAVASATATPVSIPLTSVLAGCAGGAFLADRGAFGFAYSGWEAEMAYESRTEQDRMAVEGFFQQLPYVADQ
jgi:hypothetical protein